MDRNNVKKDDENGRLSCGIYSSPTFVKVGSAIAAEIAQRKHVISQSLQMGKTYPSLGAKCM